MLSWGILDRVEAHVLSYGRYGPVGYYDHEGYDPGGYDCADLSDDDRKMVVMSGVSVDIVTWISHIICDATAGG